MTSGAGFIMSGLYIIGSTPPVLRITNSTGPIKLTDVWVQGTTVTPDTVGININNHNGAITLNRVSASHSSVSGGALLANTLGTAGITITNSSFDNNGTSSAGGMLIYTNGAVTINGSSFSYNQTGSALNMPGLYIYQAKSVAIKNTNISGNKNAGLLVENLAGSITLENVFARQNLKNGIVIEASGNITFKSVDASWNLHDGALLDTCFSSPCTNLGTGKVTISNSHFDDNANQNTGVGGLWIFARGSIALSGSSADRNGSVAFPASGAVLLTNQSPLASGVSVTKTEFMDNYVSGLMVLARGPITLTSISARNNKTAHGLYLDNTWGTSGVTLKGTSPALNFIYDNGDNTGANDDGLSIATKGNISLTNVRIDNSGGNGFYFTTLLPINITIKTSAFDYNDQNGLVLVTQGTISLNTVEASYNSGVGAMLDNMSTTVAKNVIVSASKFDHNTGGYGLNIYSKGAITLSSVSASFNTVYGARLDNTAGAPSVPAVKISNSTFNDNSGFGLDLNARGAVTITNLSACRNGGIGADIVNDVGNVYVIYSGKGYNQFNDNTGTNHGLLINTTGAVVLKKTNAYNNTGATGIFVGETILPSSVSVSGAMVAGNLYGMLIKSTGKITASGVQGAQNTNCGLFMDNSSDHTGYKSITVSKSSFSYSSTGLAALSWGLITVNSVTSNNNAVFGAILDNHASTLAVPRGVAVIGSSTLSNQFNFNGTHGLGIMTCGPISISGVTADSNGSRGINLDESITLTGGGNVTITRITTRFNGNSGIYVDTNGTFKGNSITSMLNSNPGMYDGLQLVVHDHAVTISNSIFIGNGSFGIYAVMGTGSTAPFTLTNSFFAGNLAAQVHVVR